MSDFQIPGVKLSSACPAEPPIILVIGREKSGKSCLSTTLVDQPAKGNYPLVIAWDSKGVDSCTRIGIPVPCLKVAEEQGFTWWEKGQSVLTKLETNWKKKHPFSSIVIDCASTMASRLFEDDARHNPSKDPRRNYGVTLTQCREFMSRVLEIGVPTIWLAWLREPFIEELGSGKEKKVRQVLGGAEITGSFRALLSGRADVIALIEKQKASGGNDDGDGWHRVLHTKNFAMIEANSRYALPSPMPANLGEMLAAIYSGGHNGE